MAKDFLDTPLSINDTVVGIYQASVRLPHKGPNAYRTLKPVLALGRILEVGESPKATVFWYEDERTSTITTKRLAKYGE